MKMSQLSTIVECTPAVLARLFLVSAILAFTQNAAAQGVAPGVPVATVLHLPQQHDWTIGVGVALISAPAFSGSSTQSYSFYPDLRLSYKDAVFASIPDGLGWNAFNRNSWKLGPLVKWRFGRQEKSGGSIFLISGRTDALVGMGDIAAAQEAGGFAQYSWRGIRGRVELRRGFGGHQGVVGDVLIDYSGDVGPIYYGGGVRATFADDRFTNVYYGVNGAQSAATGLAPFHTTGGLVSSGLTGFLLLPVSSRAGVTLFGGYDVLGKVVTASSLIQTRGQNDQLYLGLGFDMRFGIH